MGISSSKSKTKTSQTAQSNTSVAPTATYAPYIDAGAAALKPGFERAQQQVESILPRLDQGMDYYGDVLSGEYMNANPYLEGMIDDTNQSIADTVAGQFSGAGRYGSGYHTRTLADRIAANENQIRGAEYGRERQFMNDAPRNIAGIGTIAASLPQMPSTNYAQALAALLGRYANSSSTGTQQGTSTTTQSKSLLDNLLDIGSAASFAFGK